MTHTLRVLLVGAPQIGKTHFTYKLISEQALYKYQPTLGIDMHGFYLDDICIKLYDSGGAHKNKPIIQQYYKNSDVIVLSFSHQDAETCTELSNYIETIRQSYSKATLLLLGLNNFSNSTQPEPLEQHSIENFMAAYNIEHYLQCDANRLKDFSIFSEKLLQLRGLKQIKQPLIRHQSLFDPFWLKDHSLLKKITNVLLHSLPKNHMLNFFSFKHQENKRAVLTILNRNSDPYNSCQSVHNILNELQKHSETHQHSFKLVLEYLDDKIKYELASHHLVNTISP